MYKNKDKQREATKERVRRYREGVTATEGVTKEPVCLGGAQYNPPEIKGMTQYPDIIDKLTDKVWRTKLEKICHAFKASSNPHYVHDVWLGDTNLSTVCDYLECTR